MSIQPGDGYNFSASSSGFSLDIDKPWTPSSDGGTGIMLGFSLPKFPDPPLPPEPPDVPPVDPDIPTFVDPFVSKPRPLQFQCGVSALPVSGTPSPVLQVAMGSVTYTQSLMPYIKTGPFTDHRQAYMNFAAVLSSGVAPVTLADATSPWMLGGGGYALTGTGRWYVTLSKWDVSAATALGPLLNLEMPWVSIVKDGSAQFNTLFVDAGPSLYQNTMNIQKMEGYQEVESSGETLLDWGHCHTTYFNPRFLGNHVRILAVIDSIPAPPCEVSVVQLRAGSSTANEIQQIIFVGIYKSGTATFTYGAATTTTSFNPGTQSAFDLQQCLNTIPALNGNVIVQQAAPGVFQVEFTNTLRNTNVPTLVPNSSLTSFSTWYQVSQMHVGSQDIVIPCELNATFLMNKADLTEADDPYYANANSIPPWENISNIEAARAASLLTFVPAFATPVINDVVPRAFDTVPLVYSEEAGCTDEPSPDMDHPFKVKHVETTGGMSTYSIVSGTVNNLTPGNIGDEITVSTGTYEVWIKVPFAAGVYPATTGFVWNMGTPVPADTASEGYVRVATVNGATVTQYVTGSLWSDRIQVGAGATLNAFYYYARI
jgi:hypothetical protein